MPNPTADFPVAVHTPIDVSANSQLPLGSTAPKHTDVHGKIEQEIVATQQKIGIGTSPAASATDGQVLTKQADGSTAWETPAAGTSGITRSVNIISSNTAAGSTGSIDYVYLASGAITLTLPTAVGNTNQYTVTNIGSSTVTVATTGGQTILGSATATLPIANMSLDFISTGTDWRIM